jgi:hypothetical protein
MTRWPTSKHFTSWLTLAPEARSRVARSSALVRGAQRTVPLFLLRIAAVSVGRTSTALGAFFRRLAARAGKAKAVTATARKIAVLFYNTLRHGAAYVDRGANYYEERYRRRTIENLRRRADALGFSLIEAAATEGASQESPGYLGGRGRRHGAEERRMIIQLIDEAIRAGARREKATALLGLSSRAVARWRIENNTDDRPRGPATGAQHRLTDKERERVLTTANLPEYRNLSPRQIVPLLADRGQYIASESISIGSCAKRASSLIDSTRGLFDDIGPKSTSLVARMKSGRGTSPICVARCAAPSSICI